jgi:Ca2+-binding EF-hand superfamily protein
MVMLNNFSISKCACVAACIYLGLSNYALAAGRGYFFVVGDSQRLAANEDASAEEGLQQTLNLNFSPENREKLRRALDDYARSVDENHEQIEARRKAMHESIEARFLDADTDGDGMVTRQEATEKLPQIARHFNQVDTNEDGAITIDELEEAQARILERRKAAEMAIEEKKLQAAVEAVVNKQAETAPAKPIEAIPSKHKDARRTSVNLKKRSY